MPPAKKPQPAQGENVHQLHPPLAPPADGAGAEAVLAWAQASTREAVEKTGSAKFGGANSPKRSYMQEPALFGIVKDLQARRAFALIIDFPDAQQAGNARFLIARVRLTDVTCPVGTEGRTLEALYPCEGVDNGGFGTAKAQTYGSKYAIQKLLHVPTDDLPEQELDNPPAERPAATTTSRIPLDAAQLEALRADAQAARAGDEAFTQRFLAQLQTAYGVQRIEDLPTTDAITAMRQWVASETQRAA